MVHISIANLATKRYRANTLKAALPILQSFQCHSSFICDQMSKISTHFLCTSFFVSFSACMRVFFQHFSLFYICLLKP